MTHPSGPYPLYPPRHRSSAGRVIAWVFGIIGALVFAFVALIVVVMVAAPSHPASSAAAPVATGPLTQVDGDSAHAVANGKAGAMLPGRWHSDGQETCYWVRYSSPSMSTSTIIANDFADGPVDVYVRSGEWFKSDRCATWTRV